MNSNIDQDLRLKIDLLKACNEHEEFLKHLKDIMECHNSFDLATKEEKIFKFVLPIIQNQLDKVYNDNFSLFETLDDEVMSMLIKENLEVAFQLTDALQEILNIIYPLSPVSVSDIGSVLECIPRCILLFADHWKNSSETYRNAFTVEISKLLEVIKYLYVSYLHILEISVNIQGDSDGALLAGALTIISQLSKALYDLDPSTVISSWKCFSTVSVKYSTALENCMDLQIPINALCEDIYKALKTLSCEDLESFHRQIKILTLLMKILFKITDIYHQQLDSFSVELLIFFVKFFGLTPFHFQQKQFLSEALLILEEDIFKNIDVFLEHLVMGQSEFKNHLENISDLQRTVIGFQENPLGVINFLSEILQMVATTDFSWPDLTIKSIEVIFATIPSCHRELISDSHDRSIYQKLIVNMSAAILYQDGSFQSSEILLRNLLKDDAFVAILALEVYTLVVSNITPGECLTLLVNLLYSINELQCGIFTYRPEMVFLKSLIQRMFKILPMCLREDIIKLFGPEQYIQIWRFLGFENLPAHQVQLMINPVIKNTSECIQGIYESCTEDMPQNIAEGLDMLSTVKNLDTNDTKMDEITKFLDAFWSIDFNHDHILDNNIMNYFIIKITGVTSRCLMNSNLDFQLVFTKLKILSCKESYWVSVYKIVHFILNSLSSLDSSDIDKQHLLAQIADIVNLTTQNNSNRLLKESYLELLKNLNMTQNDTLNSLLDCLNPNVANQAFQYIQEVLPNTSMLKCFENYNTKNFKHKCLTWKEHIMSNNFSPQAKRAKMDVTLHQPIKKREFVENIPSIQAAPRTLKNNHTTNKKENTNKFNTNDDEDDSAAAEVIDRIKGEIKCLLKICKNQKLTQKNVADLRIAISQISSLM